MVNLGGGIPLHLDQTICSAAVKKQSMAAAKGKSGPAAALSRSLLDLIGGWFLLRGLPGFEQHVTIDLSTRLQRALDRCYAKRAPD